MITTEPCPDFFRCSVRVSQPRTVCSTSISKFFHQFFSLSMPPPALTLATKMSQPPKSPAVFSSQAL